MLVFDSIFFDYGNNPVLRGVYLSVPKNSITGLFGINGCGKSTLIKIGAGLLTPNDGNVFIENKIVPNGFSIKRYNHIGYLSQSTFLPSDLTVEELLTLNINSINTYKTDSIISKVINQKVSTLSGGELRYLELILLFSLDREYYLLDEPFTGIEPIVIEKIVSLIVQQKNLGKGILLTDHYHRYVTEIIDRCYLMKDGYINEIEPNESFREKLSNVGYLS